MALTDTGSAKASFVRATGVPATPAWLGVRENLNSSSLSRRN